MPTPEYSRESLRAGWRIRASAALRLSEDQVCSRRRPSLAAVIRMAVLAYAPGCQQRVLKNSKTEDLMAEGEGFELCVLIEHT